MMPAKTIQCPQCGCAVPLGKAGPAARPHISPKWGTLKRPAPETRVAHIEMMQSARDRLARLGVVTVADIGPGLLPKIKAEGRGYRKLWKELLLFGIDPGWDASAIDAEAQKKARGRDLDARRSDGLRLRAEGKTFREIADQWGVSAGRAQQIVAKALRIELRRIAREREGR